MPVKLLAKSFWQDQLKYQPLAQRLFLLANLSANFPALLNIEPTNQCNLRCRFCPTQNNGRAKGQMGWSVYQKIIDQLDPSKLRILWLFKDGEPLLHPRISQMVAYAKRKKVAGRVEIYTNGLLLTAAKARALIEAGLDSLVVSLDATNKETYRREKGSDTYNQVAENIRLFIKIRGARLKPRLLVKAIDLGQPAEKYLFRKQWQGIADQVIFQPLHNWEGTNNIKYPASSAGKQISRLIGGQANIPPHRRASKNLKYRYPCNLPWLAPAILWDGRVTSCCVNWRESELVLGDIKKQPLAKIFQGDKFRRLREAHLKQDFRDWPTCRRCQYWQQLPNMGTILKIKYQNVGA